MKYYAEKRRYVVAHKYDGLGSKNLPDWLLKLEKESPNLFNFEVNKYGDSILLDGRIPCAKGQWIIQNDLDQLFVLDDEDFREIYEEVK